MARKLLHKPHRGLLPNLTNTQHTNHYFFPFYPALGFDSTRPETLRISETLFNSVISGNTPIILKWLGSEGKVTPNEEDVSFDTLFTRNIKVGLFIHGTVTNSNYSSIFTNKTSGVTDASGNLISYTEQSIEKVISASFNKEQSLFFFGSDNKTIEANYQRLFFVAPEVAGRDVLYIISMDVERDENGDLQHTEITFKSLGDTLRAVGTTLEGFINFDGPGSYSPFPLVAPEKDWSKFPKPENYDDRFYTPARPDEFPDKMHTKKVYLSREIKNDLDRGARYFQIDFYGLYGLSALEFYGSKKTGYLEQSNTQPLLISQLIQPIIPTVNSKNQNELTLTRGLLQNINWFPKGLEEAVGYFTDPLKPKNSEGIIRLDLEPGYSRYGGIIFNINQTHLEKDIKLYGMEDLATNRLSDFKLIPWIQRGSTGERVFTKGYNNNWAEPGTEANQENRRYRSIPGMSLAETINKMSKWTISKSYLDWQGIWYQNSKSFAMKIVGAIGQAIGAIGGAFAGVGGGATSAGLGSMLGGSLVSTGLNLVMGLIPDSVFANSWSYNTVAKSNFLLPTSFCRAAYIKLATYKTEHPEKIPLELFENPNNNYLSGLLSNRNFNYSLAGELTSELRHGDETINSNSLLKEETKQIASDYLINNNYTAKFNLNDSFNIDYMALRGLGKVPYRLSFFDKYKNLIWQSTNQTQASYTGNILEWETNLLLSDFQVDSDTSFSRYTEQAIKNSQVELNLVPTPIDSQPTSEERARYRLRNIYSTLWEGEHELSSTTLIHPRRVGYGFFVFTGLMESNIDFLSLIEIPGDVNNDLELVHPEDNTKEKKLIRLMTTYGYKLNIDWVQLSPYAEFGFHRLELTGPPGVITDWSIEYLSLPYENIGTIEGRKNDEFNAYALAILRNRNGETVPIPEYSWSPNVGQNYWPENGYEGDYIRDVNTGGNFQTRFIKGTNGRFWFYTYLRQNDPGNYQLVQSNPDGGLRFYLNYGMYVTTRYSLTWVRDDSHQPSMYFKTKINLRLGK